MYATTLVPEPEIAKIAAVVLSAMLSPPFNLNPVNAAELEIAEGIFFKILKPETEFLSPARATYEPTLWINKRRQS